MKFFTYQKKKDWIGGLITADVGVTQTEESIRMIIKIRNEIIVLPAREMKNQPEIIYICHFREKEVGILPDRNNAAWAESDKTN